MQESCTHRVAPNGPRQLPPLAVALLTVASMAGMACSSPVMSPPPSPGPEIYTVGAPDELLISILPDPVIERAVVVRPDGRISVDLIGDIYAANLTPEQIAENIEKEISRFKRDAVVTVSVTSVDPKEYGPAGTWSRVMGSPSGSKEALSTEMVAVQLSISVNIVRS